MGKYPNGDPQINRDICISNKDISILNIDISIYA